MEKPIDGEVDARGIRGGYNNSTSVTDVSS